MFQLTYHARMQSEPILLPKRRCSRTLPARSVGIGVAAAASALWLGVILILASCQSASRGGNGVDSPDADAPLPLSAAFDLNRRRVAPDVYVGGVPTRGDLDELKSLGVTTIINVDAATPDLPTIESRGMSSVHVPVEYAGLQESQIALIARAIRDAPGPVYVHCHHGIHRAPAAAAAGLLALGRVERGEAEDILVDAGTSLSYPGLWDTVRTTGPFSPSVIDGDGSELPAAAEPRALATEMAAVDRDFDILKLLAGNGWQAFESHPDATPAAVAGIVHDRLRLCADIPAPSSDQIGMPADFARSADFAARLETMLARLPRSRVKRAGVYAEADKLLARLESTCRSCHQRTRNRRPR